MASRKQMNLMNRTYRMNKYAEAAPLGCIVNRVIESCMHILKTGTPLHFISGDANPGPLKVTKVDRHLRID